MIRTAQEFFEWAELQLNAEKCGALIMINHARKKYVEPFEPAVGNGLSIPALKWEDSYKYLGVNTGRERKGTMTDLANRMYMYQAAERILASKLADWQKVDALNSFVFPTARYYFDVVVLNGTRRGPLRLMPRYSRW